jgi:hypothetical protein
LNLNLLPNPSVDPSQDVEVDAGGNLIVVDSDCDGFALADLDASGTEEPDGVIIDFVWSEDGVELASGTVAVVELGVGLHNVTLTTVDEIGNETTQEIIVEVVSGSECAPDPSPSPDPTASPTPAPSPMPAGPGWVATGSLNIARDLHSGTLLQDGRVLVAGGRTAIIDVTHQFTNTCELYDPDSETWSFTGSFQGPARYVQQEVLLSDGRVLVAGGTVARTVEPNEAFHTNICEIYNPATGTWSETGSLMEERANFEAIRLSDGKVLAVGGVTESVGAATLLKTCEIFDPTTGVWSSTGALQQTNTAVTLSLMPDGKVISVGGHGGDPDGQLSACEVYDPQTRNWSPVTSLNIGRSINHQSPIFLPDGRLLIAGGNTAGGGTPTCEIYDPSSDSWSLTGSLLDPLRLVVLSGLPDGNGLAIEGWYGDSPQGRTQLYDPEAGMWSPGSSMTLHHANHAYTTFSDGHVMVISGFESIDWPNNNTWTRTCEIYTPVPVVSSSPTPSPTRETRFADQMTFPAGRSPGQMAMADFDGDMDLDVAVTNVDSETVSVLLNDGNGLLRELVTVNAGNRAVSVAAGDLNGDGTVDLAVSDRAPDSVGIHLNDGSASFASETQLVTTDHPLSVALDDFDEDNDLDLAVVGPDMLVYLNNSDATFGDPSSLSVGLGPRFVALDDLDGDGDTDMGIVVDEGRGVSVVLSRGDGTFAPEVAIFGQFNLTQTVTFGDIDDDGDQDMVGTNFEDDTISILKNSGNGDFTSPFNYFVGDGPRAVAIGDIDGDGDLDLAIANHFGRSVMILWNTGDGSFVDPTTFEARDRPYDVVLADIDGDTDLDLLVTNFGSDDISVLLNQGNP